MNVRGTCLCTQSCLPELVKSGQAGRNPDVLNMSPRTATATAALQMIPGVDLTKCRNPEIFADAACLILTSDAKITTGNFFIDDELLRAHGVSGSDLCSVTPGTTDFIPAFFVD